MMGTMNPQASRLRASVVPALLIAVAGHGHADVGVDAGGSALCTLKFTKSFPATGTDNSWDTAVDAAGNMYLTGITDSPLFPTTAGAFDTSYNGSSDAFVLKLSPTGTIVYGTFLGGTQLDQGSKIAVDSLGSAYVVGYTYSNDLPVTAGAYDTSFNGSIDAFVTKLNAAGSALVYSTFLGGDQDDFGGGIAVDLGGRATITGYTESGVYPVTPIAYDQTYNGGGDIIVSRLSAAGDSLIYSTFVGGSAFESGYGIAVDPGGRTYVSGQTMSLDFPTTAGVLQPGYGGGVADAFVIKLNPPGTNLAWATYLGGSMFDDSHALAIESSGAVYVAGRTESLNFLTTAGAFQTSYAGGRDVFLTKLAPNAASAIYSTYVGGGGEEETGDLVVDANGLAYSSGWTYSPDFPVTADACNTLPLGDYDAFHYRMNAAGNALVYSTYLGTAGADYGRGLALDGNGKVHVGGYSIGATADVFACAFR